MKSILPFLCFYFLLSSCQQEQKTSQKIVIPEFQSILDSAQVSGAILIFDAQSNTFYSNDFQEAENQLIPASTFKIPNSIIGLETGILEDEETIFKWDGNERAFSAWEKDLTLQEAFQRSCVPCYQELAGKIGTERMKEYLKTLKYGQMDVTDETIDTFWLTGASKISAFEQIDFLKRLHDNKLPITPSTHKTLLTILRIDQNETYSLSGKTGLAMNAKETVGWFVGYLEIETKIYYFATRIIPNETETSRNEFNANRKKTTFSAFKKLGVL